MSFVTLETFRIVLVSDEKKRWAMGDKTEVGVIGKRLENGMLCIRLNILNKHGQG